ncbi:hypothetical protein KAR91_69900 [Candidatus Pacearchaeota archaeon]|nr:hypothetical protein [Candidatus Pacearchaeota archaeon]
MAKEPLQFPKRAPVDPAVKKIKEMIEWNMHTDKGEFPVLVGQLWIAGKHDFATKYVSKKKIENEKDMMAEELLKNLREALNPKGEKNDTGTES